MDIDGIKIVNWVHQYYDLSFIERLKGCSLSNEFREWLIIGFSNDEITVQEETSTGKVSNHKIEFLADKTLHIPVHETELLAIIQNKKSNLDLLEENAEQVLRKYDIPKSILGGGSAPIKIAKILLKWEANKISTPNGDDQYVLYDVCTKFEKPCFGLISLFQLWKDINEKEVHRYDPLIRLNLAVLYRIAGKLEEALAETEDEKNFSCDSHTRAMICCDRAAICLDKFQKTKDRSHLSEALKNLKKSFANEKSIQVRNCWARYDALIIEK